MKKPKSIVYLGNSGFPYGLAEVQKMILISKSLILYGNTVTVICKKGIHKKVSYPELKEHGSFENIEYVYTSGNPFRDESFIKRNLQKIRGALREVLLIRKRRKNEELDYAILSTNRFYAVLFYRVLSKLYGFKLILNYAEYYPGIKKKWFQMGRRVNANLYDRYAPVLVDAVFPIGEFLVDHLKRNVPQKKYLKVPVLVDFEKYDVVDISKEEKYFLFCGDAAYNEIIKFIIDSFGCLKNAPFLLYLVINGDENKILKIKDYIAVHPERDNIKLVSKLTEKQLYSYYKNAAALLIPLRPTFQDRARFPHKIGEYLASGNPVISTNYGEITHYFKDMEDMLIAESYTINLFAGKMQFVVDNPVEAKKIGLNGKKKALDIFDYRIQAKAIDSFLESLV